MPRPYKTAAPAACESGVKCETCEEDVVEYIFHPDRTAAGVCACPWTAWTFQANGLVYRSTPRGYE